MAATRYRLDNLFAIVDVNGLQQFGWVDADRSTDHGPGRRPTRPWSTDELAAIWTAFGWRTTTLDGHDMGSIVDRLGAAIAGATDGRPTAVLARTVKGRGVSFMEDRFEWHARVPSAYETERALAELES